MAQTRNNGGAQPVTSDQFNERLKRILGAKADADRLEGRPASPPRRKWATVKS